MQVPKNLCPVSTSLYHVTGIKTIKHRFSGLKLSLYRMSLQEVQWLKRQWAPGFHGIVPVPVRLGMKTIIYVLSSLNLSLYQNCIQIDSVVLHNIDFIYEQFYDLFCILNHIHTEFDKKKFSKKSVYPLFPPRGRIYQNPFLEDACIIEVLCMQSLGLIGVKLTKFHPLFINRCLRHNIYLREKLYAQMTTRHSYGFGFGERVSACIIRVCYTLVHWCYVIDQSFTKFTSIRPRLHIFQY